MRLRGLGKPVVALLISASATLGLATALSGLRVDKTLQRGAIVLPPDCAWAAALVCDDFDGEHNCRWEKRWSCEIARPWPEVIVRHPGAAESMVLERYP